MEPEAWDGYDYERFGSRQRVRRRGRIIGYVVRQTQRRWVAFAADGHYLGHAPRRREATALLEAAA